MSTKEKILDAALTLFAENCAGYAWMLYIQERAKKLKQLKKIEKHKGH